MAKLKPQARPKIIENRRCLLLGVAGSHAGIINEYVNEIVPNICEKSLKSIEFSLKIDPKIH